MVNKVNELIKMSHLPLSKSANYNEVITIKLIKMNVYGKHGS